MTFKWLIKRRHRKDLEEIKRKIENVEKEAKRNKFKRYVVTLYYLLPNFYKRKIEEEARYSNIEDYPYYYSQISIISFLLLSIFPIYLFLIKVSFIFPVLLFIFMLIASLLIPYFSLIMSAESRRKRIEKYLPDFLILVSSNMKSGLTIDKAILFASRKEFGELSEITRKAAYEIYSGKDVDDALLDMSSYIKSQIFNKTIKLLIQGLRAGGNIAKLLEEAANDIRNTELLQKEIKTTVITYIMFIFFAGVIASPVLFAISVFLINSTMSMWKIDVSMEEMLKEYSVMNIMTIHKPKINVQMFEIFSLISLMITTFFAGLLISIIQTGGYKNALKYSPIFMLLSIAIYYGAYYLLSYLFGNMLI